MSHIGYSKKIILAVLVIILCIMLEYTTVSNYMIEYSTINEILESKTVHRDVHVVGTIEPDSFTHLYNSLIFRSSVSD